MRYLLAFIIVLAVNQAQAQFSISAGVSRQLDNMFQNRYLALVRKPELYVYNTCNVQADFVKPNLRIYTNIAYLPSTVEYDYVNYTSSGSNFGPYYSTTTYYYSKNHMEYLQFKAGTGANINTHVKNDWWSTLSFNMFSQLDQLTNYKNIECVTTKSSSYKQGINDTPTITNYPPNYGNNNIIQFNRTIMQFGFELNGKIGFKNCFLEISSGLGILQKLRTPVRTQYAYEQEEISNWSFNAGLRFGYLIKAKNESKVTKE